MRGPWDKHAGGIFYTYTMLFGVLYLPFLRQIVNSLITRFQVTSYVEIIVILRVEIVEIVDWLLVLIVERFPYDELCSNTIVEVDLLPTLLGIVLL